MSMITECFFNAEYYDTTFLPLIYVSDHKSIYETSSSREPKSQILKLGLRARLHQARPRKKVVAKPRRRHVVLLS